MARYGDRCARTGPADKPTGRLSVLEQSLRFLLGFFCRLLLLGGLCRLLLIFFVAFLRSAHLNLSSYLIARYYALVPTDPFVAGVPS